ncbi:hypothetical protein R0J93_24525, partial [Pseudoalteromonas sp. SIMBA_148]
GSSSNGATFDGGQGDDTYIIDKDILGSERVLIFDSYGSNNLQLKGINSSEVSLTRDILFIELAVGNGKVLIRSSDQLGTGGIDNIYFD